MNVRCVQLLSAVLWLGAAGCAKARSSAATEAPPAASSVAAAAPSNAATAAPSGAPAPSSEAPSELRRYAVFGVAPDDVLNVRAEPSSKSKKVYSFGPHVSNIRSSGRVQEEGGTRWIEVSFDGGTGWVNRGFLLEVHPGGACNDEAFTAAIRKLMRAVATGDGASLQELASPIRGLIVRSSLDGPTVRFAASEVGGVFSSSAAKDWGGGDFNIAPFKKQILPALKDDVAGPGAREKCGKSPDGSELSWPDDLAGLSLVAFQQPKTSHTSVAGFEYVDGKPYLAALVQY